MDKETSDLIKAMTTAGVIGTLAATSRALLTKGESRSQVLRTFFAGVVIAILLGIILRNSVLDNFWKEIIIGVAGAFISSIWPIGERFVKRYLEKRSNDVVNSNNY